MADNVFDPVKKAMQDVVAPELREVKVKWSALEQRMDDRSAATDQKIESEIAKVLAALGDAKTKNELMAVREVADLRERVAILETQIKLSSHTM